MPLDSAAYLSSLGWQGAGSGLRQDGMIRPLAIPQKRTLAGVGKDRDEAFPFWDHVFNAAANSIKIKIHNDSDQSDAESEQIGAPDLVLSRTSTGIISNRRPAVTNSGSATPKQADDTPYTNKPRLSLLAEAKRQAAYARLYASFFKGPVIAPLNEEITAKEEKKTQNPDTLVNGDTPVDKDTNARSKSNLKDSPHDETAKKTKTHSEVTIIELKDGKEQENKKRKKKNRDARSEADAVEEAGLRRPRKKRREAFTEDDSAAEVQVEDRSAQKRHKKQKSKIMELQEEITDQTNDAAHDKKRHGRKRPKKKK